MQFSYVKSSAKHELMIIFFIACNRVVHELKIEKYYKMIILVHYIYFNVNENLNKNDFTHNIFFKYYS